MAGLFSRLQVRYRSDPFSKVGKRFGAIEYDPRDTQELEVERMHEADDARRRSMRRTLRRALNRDGDGG